MVGKRSWAEFVCIARKGKTLVTWNSLPLKRAWSTEIIVEPQMTWSLPPPKKTHIAPLVPANSSPPPPPPPPPTLR